MAVAAPLFALGGASLLFKAGKSLFGKPKMPRTPPGISRNMAAEAARQNDQYRKRRGAGANEITGGAEASSGGGKTLLGQ